MILSVFVKPTFFKEPLQNIYEIRTKAVYVCLYPTYRNFLLTGRIRLSIATLFSTCS